MIIDIPTEAIFELKAILDVLETAAEFHKDLDDSQELIEPWTPSGANTIIDIPQLNVELLRRAVALKFRLRLDKI